MAKYYLQYENTRNAKYHALYTELLRTAFGSNEIVITGHHFMCEPNTGNPEADLANVNEIPSADTVLFDHQIMFMVFGRERALRLMARLSQVDCDAREPLVAEELQKLRDERGAAELDAMVARDYDSGLDWEDTHREASV